MKSWRKSSYSNSQGACVEVTTWRTSSYSHTDWTGQCVEVAAWRKSTRSYANGACVEAGNGFGVVGVRDSKNPGPVLEVAPERWGAFLGRIRAGASG